MRKLKIKRYNIRLGCGKKNWEKINKITVTIIVIIKKIIIIIIIIIAVEIVI